MGSGIRSFLASIFGSTKNRHLLLADTSSYPGTDLCDHHPNRYLCIACLRSGRRRGACSSQCTTSGWAAHRERVDHTACGRYHAALARMKLFLSDNNPGLFGLNEQERRALWLDVLVHLQKVLNLPSPENYDTLRNSLV